ncbi:MAG: hypothetical protein AVDCRST_MAG52-2715, partial [uncultured Blastococcus sp.]
DRHGSRGPRSRRAVGEQPRQDDRRVGAPAGTRGGVRGGRPGEGRRRRGDGRDVRRHRRRSMAAVRRRLLRAARRGGPPRPAPGGGRGHRTGAPDDRRDADQRARPRGRPGADDRAPGRGSGARVGPPGRRPCHGSGPATRSSRTRSGGVPVDM